MLSFQPRKMSRNSSSKVKRVFIMNLEVHTVTNYNIFTIIMYSAMQYNNNVYQSGSKSLYKKRKRETLSN